MAIHFPFLRTNLICGLLACGVLSGCGAGSSDHVHGGPVPVDPTPSIISGGPTLGYAWDSAAKTLRPVLGVPGASRIGGALTSGYIAAAASPESSVAVLIAKDGSLKTQRLPSGHPSLLGGSNVAANSRIVFSPSGNNALVYAVGTSAVTVVINLTATPQAQAMRTPPNLQGAAISDTAAVAVVAGSSGLQLSLLNGDGTFLASLRGYGGVNFLFGVDDLLAADSIANTVTVVRHSSTAPTLQTISASVLKAPIDIAASQDGHWAVIANQSDSSVARLDLTGSSPPLRVPCQCQPTQLAALKGNAVFRVTALTMGPAWIVDASLAVPKTMFIPAAPVLGGGQ